MPVSLVEIVALVAWSYALYRYIYGDEPPRRDEIDFSFWGFVIKAIGFAVGFFVKGGAATVTALWNVVRALGSNITRLASSAATVFRRTFDLFGRFWDGVLKPFIGFVNKSILSIHTWLKNTFGPILKIIERIRSEVLKIYNRFFKPILDTIEAVRGVLRVLGFLRLDFAKKLDEQLARLEANVLRPIVEIMGRLNQASDFINRIIDGNGFFQRYTLLRSLILYQRDALAVWWRSIHRPLGGDALSAYNAAPGAVPLQAVAADVRAYTAELDTPNRARAEEHAADVSIRIRQPGGF